LPEFKQRGCEIVGVSVDSKYSHQQWLTQPRNQGGIQGTAFPLLSDIKKTASRDYGVLSEGAGISFRGLFIINPDGMIEVEMVNNFPIGRSSDEILRLVDAAQESKKGMVCPMNFAKGKEAINPKDAKAWFTKNAK
jgi:alkyl hydroperoxide reductase subunit AhpC